MGTRFEVQAGTGYCQTSPFNYIGAKSCTRTSEVIMEPDLNFACWAPSLGLHVTRVLDSKLSCSRTTLLGGYKAEHHQDYMAPAKCLEAPPSLK